MLADSLYTSVTMPEGSEDAKVAEVAEDAEDTEDTEDTENSVLKVGVCSSCDEAVLDSSRNVMLVAKDATPSISQLGKALQKTFFGAVVAVSSDGVLVLDSAHFSGKTVYLCHSLLLGGQKERVVSALHHAHRVFVVGPSNHSHQSFGAGIDPCWCVVDVGRVPVSLHGVGVLYPRFFDPQGGYFDRIQSGHVFQNLKESDKPGTAYRTGIYLTPTTVDPATNNVRFRVLRCSTNLSGPTGNFRAVDHEVVNSLNQEASCIFQEGHALLNHVLAQIYWNTPATDTSKMSKAKIARHADKTKDMPRNGIMAFCTFYHLLHEKLQPATSIATSTAATDATAAPGAVCEVDMFDWKRRGAKSTDDPSGLTTLQFRLKDEVADDANKSTGLTKEFTVRLYPESVFFMSLSTNRLYTHEIRPSALEVPLLPTRLGYVVRCSNTEALSLAGDGQTYVQVNKLQQQQQPQQHQAHGVLEYDGMQFAKMVLPTPEAVKQLRATYKEENTTSGFVDYQDRFMFSMNTGDYARPEVEFVSYNVATGIERSSKANLFADLMKNIAFEDVCKGRRGAVLVKSDTRGTPIVRTTSAYARPAKYFPPVYERLASRIRAIVGLPPHALNNALVEVYDSKYTKMAYHSDQAQDLESGSHIAVYSCYSDPEALPTRKLVIKAKSPNANDKVPSESSASTCADGAAFEIVLLHNTVVVWSLDTNKAFVHKIVPIVSAIHAAADEAPDRQLWLGVTLRTSKTFVKSTAVGKGVEMLMIAPDAASEASSEAVTKAAKPEVEATQQHRCEFADGRPLVLANSDSSCGPACLAYYAMRAQENNTTDFVWPDLDFTVSRSDIMPPIE